MLTQTALLVMIGNTLTYASPLIYAGLGGVISEKSGVTNIGIEGMMTVGAITAVIAAYYSGNPWLGFLAGGIGGLIMALLHAFASITLNANQTISGVAINYIGSGLSIYLARLFFDGATQTKPVPNKLPKLLTFLFKDPTGGWAVALNQSAAVFIAIILTALMSMLLRHTRTGLRIRSVGEHPHAADTLGINVFGIRYACVLVSGFLSGLGGATMTLSVVSSFSPTAISGHGFIALAAVIFGRWSPLGTTAACLMFGFAQALVVFLGGGSFEINTKLLSMIPYVLTLLVLILMRGKSAAPKADGEPFVKS